MDSEPPGQRASPYPPAEARRRIAARFADLLLPVALVWLGPVTGARIAFTLFAAALSLCADSLFGAGRSFGKRVFGLRTIVLATRRPASTLAGMKRNLPFAASLLVALLPNHLARWEAMGTLLVVLAIEAAFALRPLARDLGQRRVGDLWAGTQVIDASVALHLPEISPLPAQRAFVSPPAAHRERPAARNLDAFQPEAGSRKPEAPEGTACASP